MRIYSTGTRVKDMKSRLLTFDRTRDLAEQGDASAQYNLALKYNDGQGVTQNYAQAVEWYRKAAEQGDARAQNNLGLMYYEGQGVPKNYVMAYAWISLAAAQSHEKANTVINHLEKMMTPNQIAEAQKLASRLHKNVGRFGRH